VSAPPGRERNRNERIIAHPLARLAVDRVKALLDLLWRERDLVNGANVRRFLSRNARNRREW
jgi:hypothetical protein